MFKLTESLAKKLNDETPKATQAIKEKSDIRIIMQHLEQISLVARVNAEVSDDPESRFVSFVLDSINSVIESRYRNKRDEWFRLNQPTFENMLPSFAIYVENVSNALLAGSFNNAINASKDFFVATWKQISMITD